MTIPLERFLNVRSAGGATFSPDGRQAAFITNVTGVAQLWQVQVPRRSSAAFSEARRIEPATAGWPAQLTFFHESVRGAAYNPVHHVVLFSMDAGGNERTQLHLLRGLAGDKDHGLGEGWDFANLTDDPKAIHQFGGWSRSGSKIAFSANRTKPDRFDVYVQEVMGRQDAASEPAKLLRQGPGGYFHPAGWSPDDEWLLIHRPASNFDHDLYLLRVATGELKHLTPHEGEIQYESPRWSHDGKHVYCTTTHGGRDLSALARIEAATGTFTILDAPDCEVVSVEPSPKGRWLAWTLNVDGRSELRVKDLKTGKVASPSNLPLGVIGGLEFAPDDSRLAFTFDGPRHNPDVWIWDLVEAESPAPPRGEAYQLTHASRAGIPFSRFVEPELVKYRSFDGLEIPAWFYPPRPAAAGGDHGAPDRRPPPVIVYPHGGPESQTRPNFNALFQYFLQAGYGIFAPNVRGSSGYGTRFLNLDNTVKRMDSVTDMAYGVHWLRDNNKADPKRIAVYGGSYGGFMVLAGVTNHPDLFAAGVDVVGIANFVTFLENTGAYRRANREAEYGNLREHREFLEKISPIHHVDKIRCPMMVIHGANDPRVPVGEAEQIVAALKQRGIPVEYLRYEDEGHGLAKLKNRLDAYPKMVAFLDKHLRAG